MKMTIDTSRFNAAARALSTVSGVPLVRVLEAEAAKVLEKAASLTPSAAVAKIRAAHEMGRRKYEGAPPESYAPKTAQGRRHRATIQLSPNGRIWYNVRQHRLPNSIWNAIRRKNRAALKEALGARGLAAQAWLKLATLAGLVIKVPGYVRRALPRTGRTYQNETYKQTTGTEKSGIYFATTQPTLRAIGGDRILSRALSGRVKYFETSLKKGVFTQLRTIASRYPGLRAHLPAA
jgi:hypothetical protein